MPAPYSGVIIRHNDPSWPERLRYILEPDFIQFARKRQAQACKDKLENGWYTGRRANGTPRWVPVPLDQQVRKVNELHFLEGWGPRAVAARYDLHEVVFHHVHGILSALPSPQDQVLAKRMTDIGSAPLYFCQHGQVGADPYLYSNLFGPAELYDALRAPAAPPPAGMASV